MLFNRRIAKAKKLTEARIQHAAQVEAAIEAAKKIQDPATKVLELHGIALNAEDRNSREKTAINSESTKKGSKAYLGTTAGVVAASVGAMVITGGAATPFVVGGLLASIPGSTFAGDKRKKSVQKNLQQSAETHFATMEELAARATELLDTTIEENVKAISESSQYEEVLQVPELSKKFGAAAGKQFAADQAALEEAREAAKPGEEKTHETPAQKKTKPDYTKLTKFNR